MIVVFDVYMNGEKTSPIVVEDNKHIFSSEASLVKEIKYLISEFKTHCYNTGGSYHPAHFVNYVNKYTKLAAAFGFPRQNVRIDF